MSHVLSPLSPPWPDDVEALLARYPKQNGYLLGLFRVFANSPRFLARGVANLLDADSPLSLRLRELAILRVTANLGCEYEWGVHAAIFARAAGLSDDELAATCGEGEWQGQDAVLIESIDALCAGGKLHALCLERFRECFNSAQQLEILALAGNYHTVSFVANAADLPPEPFAARFPGH